LTSGLLRPGARPRLTFGSPQEFLDARELPIEPWASPKPTDLHVVPVYKIEHSEPTHFHRPHGGHHSAWRRKLGHFVTGPSGEWAGRQPLYGPLVYCADGGWELEKLCVRLSVPQYAIIHVRGPARDGLGIPPASRRPIRSPRNGTFG